MKSFILTAILILTLCFTTKANQDCIWVSSKSGLTIHFVASCDFKNPLFLDSIVHEIVTLANRQDTSVKILVFVNLGQLSFPDAEYSNFFSIAYDTLRGIDDDYIFNYYSHEENKSTSQNGGLNKFQSQKVSLDINSTSSNEINEIGIKIIYNRDYRLGEAIWADIIKAIIYAVNNVASIKTQQRQETARYKFNGWYLSLVTLDTFSINRILGKEPVKNATQAKPVVTRNTTYFIIAGAALFIILVLLFVRKKYSR